MVRAGSGVEYLPPLTSFMWTGRCPDSQGTAGEGCQGGLHRGQKPQEDGKARKCVSSKILDKRDVFLSGSCLGPVFLTDTRGWSVDSTALPERRWDLRACKAGQKRPEGSLVQALAITGMLVHLRCSTHARWSFVEKCSGSSVPIPLTMGSALHNSTAQHPLTVKALH